MVRTTLNRANRGHIALHRQRVPASFEKKISLEQHRKAADYSVAKLDAELVFSIINDALLILWTLGGGLEFLAQWVASWQTGPIWSGILFFAVFGLISLLLSLPQSIYSTFVIEEKFGFNKTGPGLFVKDMLKGLVLSGLIGLPLVGGILFLFQLLGNYWWPCAFALVALFQIILQWAFPKFIAPLFYKFTPIEEGEVKEKAISLLAKIGFTSKGIFVMNASTRSTHGNAFFTGLGRNKRIVFFDTLLKTLSANQITAVLAHELGHFKKKHIVKKLLVANLFSLVGFALLGFLYTYEPFFKGHGVETMEAYTALLLFSLVVGVYTFFITPLTSIHSRRHEF